MNRYFAAAPSTVKDPLQDQVITELAAKYGKTPAQVILRWHIEHGLCAIPKSVKAHRIAENIGTFDFSLTPDEVAAIDALDTGVRGGRTRTRSGSTPSPDPSMARGGPRGHPSPFHP